jgi:capsular exopolysaccharide synthesis family protein
MLLMACFGAVVLPFGLSVAYESIVRRVSSPEQLSKESLLPVLGEVTRFPMRRIAGSAKALPAAEQRQLMIYTESIESLRTNLMLTENLGVPGKGKVIAICSAASGEGKTSIATSLGMSIAEATNQPTLVLDADLRAPEISKFFEVPNHPGVSEVFCRKAEIEKAIHRVGGTQTYVLPAGKQRVNPHHILQGSKIDDLLTALREKFTTIIIDTPPVLAASESLVYAQAADLVVFCSLADVSRAKQVHAAVDRLQSTGANIAGAVLSGVRFNRYVYRYGTYTHA